MKLTLEILSSYLPYRLMCMVDENVARLDAVYSDGTCCFHELVEAEHGFKSIKPILKPISEADIYIRSQFNKFDHVQECDNEAINLFCFEKLNTEEFLSELDLSKLPYDSIQWLLKNHYDVFGLLNVQSMASIRLAWER